MAVNPGAPYDVLVVGAGMIGSSAAKHLLALNPQLKVGLIGPLATEVMQENTIHGAHYDEGRITRELDNDPVWSTLALRSIQRYREIERQSGINFYNEVGYLLLGKTEDPRLAENAKVAHQNKVMHQVIKGDDLELKFPFLKVTGDTQGFFTSQNSGYISARFFVEAQRQVAKNLGCDVIDDIARKAEETKGCREVTTDRGLRLKARKILLATGAFTHCRDLLPKEKLPLVKHHCTTVLLSEIAEKDLPHFLSMPSLSVSQYCPTLKGECKDTGFYILPPIQYPNGKWYLKIGHNRDVHKIVESPKEIDDWYKQKTTEDEVKPLLFKARENVFKGMKPVGEHFDQCVICMTASERPYIDMVTPSVGVALGGCGWAAKSSDEIGRVAARMIKKGSWDYDLPKEYFKCHFNCQRTSKL